MIERTRIGTGHYCTMQYLLDRCTPGCQGTSSRCQPPLISLLSEELFGRRRNRRHPYLDIVDLVWHLGHHLGLRIHLSRNPRRCSYLSHLALGSQT
jgi:hypothetical protein